MIILLIVSLPLPFKRQENSLSLIFPREIKDNMRVSAAMIRCEIEASVMGHECQWKGRDQHTIIKMTKYTKQKFPSKVRNIK